MRSVIPKERLQRMLGLRRRAKVLTTGVKSALLFGALALVGLIVARMDLSPNLRHVRVGFLSGNERGNYYAVVNAVAAETRRQKGRVENIPSAGSVENLARLVAGKARCDVHFALVQEGIEWPAGANLELIGRLTRPESLIFLGRDADRIKTPEDLRGARVGIGPTGSGTEYLARRALAPLTDLELKLSTLPIDEQLAKLERGELDLGAMVIDDDARLMHEAVRERKLQVLSIPYPETFAKRLPFTRVGHIPAGQYDVVHPFPPEDKQVLHVDTLIVGNGCASRSVVQGIVTAIAEVSPAFVRYNHDTANLTGLPLAPAARSYYDNDGPDIVGSYLPWLIDIMPTASWIQLILGVSMLFNAMAFGNRYLLWRIDDARVRIESDIPRLFEPGITVGEIAEMPVSDRQRTPQARAQLDDIMNRLVALADRCRRHSMSVLVPMGQEMAYRHQETLIADLLYALRAFRDRLGA